MNSCFPSISSWSGFPEMGQEGDNLSLSFLPKGTHAIDNSKKDDTGEREKKNNSLTLDSVGLEAKIL